MPTLKQRVEDLAVRIATEFKSLRNVTGSLNSLATTNKTNLVAALNELQAICATAAAINDSASGSNTTYSSNKIAQLIAAAKSEIIGGADSAHDTLVEIQALLNSEQGSINTILTLIGNCVRYDQAQSLTNAQKAQVLANIGGASSADIGDVSAANFVAVFEAALV